MNTTRTGKIARLPSRIRDQLNRRLYDGEQAKHLAAWLNILPQVQATMAAVFAGRPIRPQNLSEWKQGGYRDWLLQQEALPLARQLTQDPALLRSRLSVADFLAHSIAARYALAACALPPQDGPEQWRRLRELCADAVQLRRGDHAAERLRLDSERIGKPAMPPLRERAVPGLHSVPGIVYTQRMQVAPADGPNIRVAKTYDAMSQEATDFICGELKERPDLLLCASAGGTPTRAYELLAARYARDPGLFKQMRVLQIDEWCGLAPGNPATCRADLQTKILGPLHITADRYKGFRTDAPEPETECGRIARWLAACGPIDICILGLGANGHVAMNEPAAALTPHAHVAELARSSRSHAMLKTLPKKPRYGLTLGMGDILRSRRVLLLVNGKRKRPALSRLMKPIIATRFPASFLWLHPDATVLCDREAAVDVPVRS